MEDLSRLEVRRLAPTELAACQSLAYGREWHYPDHTWKLLFDVGELHGIFDDRGDLLTVATLVRFGQELATIGMVLTDQRLEGRGLARRVMERLLERAEPVVVTLYATSQGRPLYEKLGFVASANSTIYVGRPEFATRSVPRSRIATPADLPGMLALDARALGADRSDLVVRLFGYAVQVRVIERDGQVVGYGGAWRTSDSLALGPVLAADTADALELLDDLAAASRGPVRLEVSSERPALAEWAGARGLTDRAVLTIMATQGRPLPGERGSWHAPLMLAIN